ncbi:5,6-dimethylbenzimidazole synthase [Microseira wollei]|uniref:5,6-dimethylbenzimidazole synthase n=1 Tax=Microseira wollei NIES-4236 TaxID=2530354 RepID=A0AAV3XKC3_9CYAN|nr:5,6-dimethylbenzimidazole synthase [Microseira wollei]GET42365.1 nitroreductase family protein [Microseira wollei NIES-4236]
MTKINQNIHRFGEEERQGVYRAIYERRDIRSYFTPTPIEDDVLARLLDAAHHAPSVGMMQPWRFILIRDAGVRQSVYELFQQANEAASSIYEDKQKALYMSLKLAGILETPVNLCVTCDITSQRGRGLGRQTMPETAIYSTVCAIQNLWLAARAEGIGVGWVSIFEPERLGSLLGIPAEMVLVGYLCIGYASQFDAQSELQTRGWEVPSQLPNLIHFDRYGNTDEKRAAELLSALTKTNGFQAPSF